MANKRGKTYEALDMAAFNRRIMRGMVRRAAEGDRDVLVALAQTQVDLDAAMRDAIAALRDKGCSWADVARELGITRQAAQQRYGRAA